MFLDTFAGEGYILVSHRAKRSGGVAQSVRAPACHAGGRGFESRPPATLPVRATGASAGSGAGNEASLNPLLGEYLPILIFLGIAVVVAAVAVGASYVIAGEIPDPDKNAHTSAASILRDSRGKFDVRFILSRSCSSSSISRSPSSSLGSISWETSAFWVWSMMVFLAILTVGFI